MAKKPGPPSRQELYGMLIKTAPTAIKVISRAARGKRWNSKIINSVQLGAAKMILNRCLPELKAMEVSGSEGGPIQVNVVSNYITNVTSTFEPSEGSVEGSDTVQGSGVAPQGEKDDNSAGEDPSGSLQPAP